MFYVYMVQNSKNKLYVGISENVKKRLDYHNSKQGAKFTKYTPNFKIVFTEKYPTMANARKREIQIKKWRREKKLMLIDKYRRGSETKMK